VSLTDQAPVIAQDAGWWWPVEDHHARAVILRDCQPAIAQLLSHIPGRSVIVQAGANVGVYPVALTDHFSMVVTYEPDPTNYTCLVKNLAARDSLRRVQAFNAALGQTAGTCAPVEVHPRNCGAHRVDFGRGNVRVVRIDDLGLERCDCIWLDVEGSELFALKGAAATVERFSPTIACEDKGLDARFFGVEPGSLQAWLAEREYSEVDRIGRDKIYRRQS